MMPLRGDDYSSPLESTIGAPKVIAELTGGPLPDEREHFVPQVCHRFGAGGFHVEAEQRFGVGGAQVDPAAVAEADGEPVEPVGGDTRAGPGRLYLVQLGQYVGDLAVDLPRCGVAGVGGGELGHGLVLPAEGGEDMQGGEHASVGAPEVAEVVVTGVLAAEDGVVLGHEGFHVGVTDPGPDRAAAVLADDLDSGGAGDDVVNDHGAGVAGQFAGGDQADDRRGRDRFAVFVDEEAAVGVAVEGQPEVGAGFADLGLAVGQVGWFQRVGFVVGEGAVQFEVQRDDLDGQPGEHLGHHVPGHTVPGIGDDLEWPDAVERDEGPQVLDVAAGQILASDRSLCRCRCGDVAGFQPGADLGQAGVLADRGGAG